MHWVITCDGSVKDVFIGTDVLRGTPEGACLSDIVGSWRYPTQSGPAALPVQVPIACDP
jgi:hypothetical protein